jgi:serine/threonine protein phosphatase PrpC
MLTNSSKSPADNKNTSPRDDDFTIPAAITDAGLERELNEDRYAVIDSRSGLAWLVCDGMGGAAGGELAAQLAIESIRSELEALPPRAPEEAIVGSIQESNRLIVLRRQNPLFSQMGTTVVGAIFYPPEVVIAHAGDSRAYLIRDGSIEQLTVDHTYVQELVDRGEIRHEDALTHPEAHVLTRCIGSEPSLRVDTKRLWIWPTKDEGSGDVLLLCTDGLYSQVDDSEIASLATANSPQRACALLVELAKARGGYDNITVAIIPLGGELRDKPPVGFKEGAHIKRMRAQSGDGQVVERGPKRDVFIIVMLGLLSSLLTIVVFLFFVSQ